MNIAKLRQLVVDEGNDFYFTYKGKRAGIENTIKDRRIIYKVWWGEKEKKYSTFDEVITDKFYGGESITELVTKKKISIDFV